MSELPWELLGPCLALIWLGLDPVLCSIRLCTWLWTPESWLSWDLRWIRQVGSGHQPVMTSPLLSFPSLAQPGPNISSPGRASSPSLAEGCTFSFLQDCTCKSMLPQTSIPLPWHLLLANLVLIYTLESRAGEL